MKFNEDSRVKIPTVLHLMRLGYSYLSKRDSTWDESTNIFQDIFFESLQRINPELELEDLPGLLHEVSLLLENEDLGRAFYHRLTNRSGVRLIDFENFDNNIFNVVTELTYKKDDEEFRPDIILLVNGMPLVFIEVKKPNNRDGVLAERRRIEARFENKKFRKFVNLTQLMLFSNNMEYDDDSLEPIEGAFYATSSYEKPKFNFFREEEEFDLSQLLKPLSDDSEDFVLQDNNLISIKTSPEFITNKNPDTPTSRLCTSLFQRKRFEFILRYAFAYVRGSKGIERHVMRYPQMFASKALRTKLDEGIKKGIVWHTQGSGKTALAYYNVKYLTDYFQKRDVLPKFYFVVDRLDLMAQASREFKARGLVVHKVNSRDEFAKDIKSTSAIHNDSGKPEITVVNIQRFKDDPDVIKSTDYLLSIQRVFFLDEVHRSYNPKGSFLANLIQADRDAMKIGLTGTPLLGKEYSSRKLFGEYIHKYYYNASIKDGYTLRLIREEIETKYKLVLQKALEQVKVLKGDADHKTIYAHHKFVEPMLDYIIEDFEQTRLRMSDSSIGGMVVCDSSEQAKEMYKIFQAKYADRRVGGTAPDGYGEHIAQERLVTTAELILHDVGTKNERKDLVEDFKDGKIDFLFVYNMLLTGFDANRLKKLYLGRVIKAHNLLQALTRVNRPYKEFRYGYVVDFADIQREFERTNQDYFKELQEELGDELVHYDNLFKSQEEIDREVQEVKEALFYFDTENAEIFSKQINEIDDRSEMLKLVKALESAKDLYNLIHMSGNHEFLDKLDFDKFRILLREARNRLQLINTKEALENKVDTTNLLNVALEDVMFAFTKISEKELIIADNLKNSLRKTREMLGGNFDPKDPEFVSLKDELERLFKKRNLTDVSKDEMESNIKDLEEIYSKARELDRRNELLRAKYDNDSKYARVHKRLMEKDPLTDSEMRLFEALRDLKEEVDNRILQNSKILENESFVEKMIMGMIVKRFRDLRTPPLSADSLKRVNGLVVKEYMEEFYGLAA